MPGIGLGVAVAALKKALLDGAGVGDDHLWWASELGEFKIDAAMADATSKSCSESLPGHACGFALYLWWGAAGDEEAVGGDAWRGMGTVHEDVADIFGGAGAVEISTSRGCIYAGDLGRFEAAWAQLKNVHFYAEHGVF